MRSKVALVVAVMLGLLSALLVHQYIKKKTVQADKDSTVMDWIAANRRIKKGDVILDPNTYFRKRSIQATATPVGAIAWERRGEYRGKRIYRNVNGGELLMSEFFMPTPTAADEAALQTIPKGLRALTVAVDQITGVAGLLKPFSKVDIIVVFEEVGVGGGRGAAGSQAAFAMTLLSNVTVYAIDNRTAAAPRSRATSRRNYSAVTLAVSEAEAEMLALAQAKGSLILTMRQRVDDSARMYKSGEQMISMRTILSQSQELNRKRQKRLADEAELPVSKKPGE